jgi:hypothetical protein
MRLRRRPRHAAPKSGAPRHVRPRRQARWRPWRSRTFATAGLVLALVGAVTLSVKAVGPAAPAGPSPTAALLGAWVKGASASPSTQQAATSQLETAIGRKLAIGHSYVPWGQRLGRLPALNAAAGRMPLITFGAGADPRSVAAGRSDAYLTSLARDVAAVGRPVLLRYAWTMDRAALRRSPRSVSPFVAAWRHVHHLFATHGVLGAWVWSPGADVFAGARGGASRYWPGSRYVDWVGADGFNAAACNGSAWTDFATIFKAFYAWGSARGKPLMVTETGTVEDRADAGRKRQWFLDAAGTLARSMPRIRAVVYRAEAGRCDWRPDTSAPSMEGFVRLAQDPFFGGSTAPSPPPPTVATTTTTTTLAPTTTRTTTTTTTLPSSETCNRVTTPPQYGAGSVGRGNEVRDVTGTQATPATFSAVHNGAEPGDQILMRAGRYAGFTARPGVTYRPYDCEAVTVTGTVRLNDNSDVAGLTVSVPSSSWAVRIGPGSSSNPISKPTLRNITVRGGTIEAVRVDGYVVGARIEGSDLDGGLNNHVVKVRSNGGFPSVTLVNSVLHKDAAFAYGVTEDLFQAEQADDVLLDHISFGPNIEGTPAEDFVDIKNGGGASPTITVRNSFFPGAQVDGECLLIQASATANLVEANHFNGCDSASPFSVGAKNTGNPGATIRSNLFEDSTMRFRRGTSSRFGPGNVMDGGRFQLGTTTTGDVPTALTITGSMFSQTEIVDNGGTYTCDATNNFDHLVGDNLRLS